MWSISYWFSTFSTMLSTMMMMTMMMFITMMVMMMMFMFMMSFWCWWSIFKCWRIFWRFFNWPDFSWNICWSRYNTWYLWKWIFYYQKKIKAIKVYSKIRRILSWYHSWLYSTSINFYLLEAKAWACCEYIDQKKYSLTAGGGGASTLIYICGIASTLSRFLTE